MFDLFFLMAFIGSPSSGISTKTTLEGLALVLVLETLSEFELTEDEKNICSSSGQVPNAQKKVS
jgi:hypothetical protein